MARHAGLPSHAAHSYRRANHQMTDPVISADAATVITAVPSILCRHVLRLPSKRAAVLRAGLRLVGSSDIFAFYAAESRYRDWSAEVGAVDDALAVKGPWRRLRYRTMYTVWARTSSLAVGRSSDEQFVEGRFRVVYGIEWSSTLDPLHDAMLDRLDRLESARAPTSSISTPSSSQTSFSFWDSLPTGSAARAVDDPIDEDESKRTGGSTEQKRRKSAGCGRRLPGPRRSKHAVVPAVGPAGARNLRGVGRHLSSHAPRGRLSLTALCRHSVRHAHPQGPMGWTSRASRAARTATRAD